MKKAVLFLEYGNAGRQSFSSGAERAKSELLEWLCQ